MADFRIVVRVDPSGAVRGTRQVEGQLNRVNRAADRTRQLLTRAFAFAGLGIGIRSLVGLADTFTSIQNRIRVVTNSTSELNTVTEELFAISGRTRSSFQATAEVYSRTALATKELGISQAATLQFTESLNQAVILSGAGAQEANNALIQLSQGLASGALRGDELRSVLEQLPVVADVISSSLGVTRGELRELGAEGKISAEIIVVAFEKARERLAEDFGKTIPTIAQAFQRLNDTLTLFLGEAGKASSASANFAKSIVFLADNIGIVIEAFGVAAVATAAYFASFKIAELATFIQFQLQTAKAVTTGNAQLINGVAAQRAKSAATLAAAQTDLVARNAAIAVAQAEAVRTQAILSSQVALARAQIARATATCEESLALEHKRRTMP